MLFMFTSMNVMAQKIESKKEDPFEGISVITTKVANTNKMINDNIGIIVDNSVDGIYSALERLFLERDLLLKLKKNLINYSYAEENKMILRQINELLEVSCEK